jgi:hypothetical protein
MKGYVGVVERLSGRIWWSVKVGEFMRRIKWEV